MNSKGRLETGVLFCLTRGSSSGTVARMGRIIQLENIQEEDPMDKSVGFEPPEHRILPGTAAGTLIYKSRPLTQFSIDALGEFHFKPMNPEYPKPIKAELREIDGEYQGFVFTFDEYVELNQFHILLSYEVDER
jgi:hypothetical protein